MRELIIRNLDDAAVQRLEQRATANGHSLEDQIRHILITSGEVGFLDQDARQTAVEYIAALEKTVQELNAAAVEDAATIERLKKMVLEERQRFENLISVPVLPSDTLTGTNNDGRNRTTG